jgi:electron transport complex protein RnfG
MSDENKRKTGEEQAERPKTPHTPKNAKPKGAKIKPKAPARSPKMAKEPEKPDAKKTTTDLKTDKVSKLAVIVGENEKPENTKADTAAAKEKAVAPARAKTPRKDGTDDDFKNRIWNPWLRPAVVLVAICLITSLLLGLTNSLTTPYIEANTRAAAESARREVLPTADNFKDITPSPLPKGITSVHEASNGAGYVIEAYSVGYGGEVPVMVGFGSDGEISGVKFLDNSETPGLGKNLNTKLQFAAQFAGMPANEDIEAGGIDTDAMAGATISTNAALSAINIARQYYFIELAGGTLNYPLSDEVLEQLFPGAASWDALSITAPNVAGAWRGNDGTYVIIGQGSSMGSRPVTAAVAMDGNGVILGLWCDTSGETEGLGDVVGQDNLFLNEFVDKNNTDGIDTVGGTTVTKDAIVGAVNAALAALPLAKEA